MNDWGSEIEVAETRNAGWGWRCHCCDLTTLNLDEVEAARQAREHRISSGHVWQAARVGGGE